MAPAAPLTTRDLNRATLARQGLLEPIRGSAADAVRQAGSLQAQHPEWPPVALAARAQSAPRYEYLTIDDHGWDVDLRTISRFDAYPVAARRYIEAIEARLGGLVTGDLPEADRLRQIDRIPLPQFRLAHDD